MGRFKWGLFTGAAISLLISELRSGGPPKGLRLVRRPGRVHLPPYTWSVGPGGGTEEIRIPRGGAGKELLIGRIHVPQGAVSGEVTFNIEVPESDLYQIEIRSSGTVDLQQPVELTLSHAGAAPPGKGKRFRICRVDENENILDDLCGADIGSKEEVTSALDRFSRFAVAIG